MLRKDFETEEVSGAVFTLNEGEVRQILGFLDEMLAGLPKVEAVSEPCSASDVPRWFNEVMKKEA